MTDDRALRWGLRLALGVGALVAVAATWSLATRTGPPLATALRALVALGGVGTVGVAWVLAGRAVPEAGAVLAMLGSVLALSGPALSIARDGPPFLRVGMAVAYAAALLGAALVAADRLRASDTP